MYITVDIQRMKQDSGVQTEEVTESAITGLMKRTENWFRTKNTI